MTLKAWFEETGKPVAEFASEIGRNRATVYKYIAGTLEPRSGVKHKIVTATAGAVALPDLVPSA